MFDCIFKKKIYILVSINEDQFNKYIILYIFILLLCCVDFHV